MDERRSALVVATSAYTDERLRALRAPAADAEALRAVLSDESIGGFDVAVSLNEPDYRVRERLAEFFADRRTDDLLLVHFSCHGVKDDDGHLYFATSNTRLSILDATGLPSEFVSRQMAKSRSRRIVLLLDCCYSGAFARGFTSKADSTVDVIDRFRGKGHVVLTASTALEYAWVEEELTGTGTPSVFTQALVDGLRTGEADLNGDGCISVDELYDYLHDRVREKTPNQNPQKWAYAEEGDLFIARSQRQQVPAEGLPPELTAALSSPFPGIRAGAVDELAGLLRSGAAPVAAAAGEALQRLTDDDSSRVRRAARRALGDERRRTQSDTELLLPPPPPWWKRRGALLAALAVVALAALAGLAGLLALALDGDDRQDAGPNPATTGPEPKPTPAWRRVAAGASTEIPGQQTPLAVAAAGGRAVVVGWHRPRPKGSKDVLASWVFEGGRIERPVLGGQGRMTDVVSRGPMVIAVGWTGPETDRARQDAQVWVSSGGSRWRAVCPADACGDEAPGAGTGQGIRAVARSPRLGFVAVGYDTREGLDGAVWLSPTGESGWRRVAVDLPTFEGETGAGDQELTDVLVTSQGQLVAVGRDRLGGRVWTSADGEEWQRAPGDFTASGGSIALNAVTEWQGDLFAVGYQGDENANERAAAVWTRPQGERVWHRASVSAFEPRGQELHDVIGFRDMLVAVGVDDRTSGRARAVAWASRNGILWKRQVLEGAGPEGDAEADAVTLLGGRLLAVGNAPSPEDPSSTRELDAALWIFGARE